MGTGIFDVKGIEWDCDDATILDELPSETYVTIDTNFYDEYEYHDVISEMLSREYGWCPLSFHYDEISE